ncbi:hypothetical protein IWQ60_010795 [Tieghemiomyces parasiticus]|uniref:Transmembrane protein n=1 Tax=Tieghemiomyces parasiticus TaxID=78921 RepID=A0A9W7ZTJ2_9FUNG|nr:hypothetical protein IWQ60_010795 [Tieghemiomyces parasiticus]
MATIPSTPVRTVVGSAQPSEYNNDQKADDDEGAAADVTDDDDSIYFYRTHIYKPHRTDIYLSLIVIAGFILATVVFCGAIALIIQYEVNVAAAAFCILSCAIVCGLFVTTCTRIYLSLRRRQLAAKAQKTAEKPTCASFPNPSLGTFSMVGSSRYPTSSAVMVHARLDLAPPALPLPPTGTPMSFDTGLIRAPPQSQVKTPTFHSMSAIQPLPKVAMA